MPAAVLAQSGPDYTSVFFWLLVLMVLLLGGFVGVTYLRKWLKSEESAESGGDVFSLSDLRQMRKDGRITEEEFERLKAQIVATLKPKAKPPEQGKPSGEEPPKGLQP